MIVALGPIVQHDADPARALGVAATFLPGVGKRAGREGKTGVGKKLVGHGASPSFDMDRIKATRYAVNMDSAFCMAEMAREETAIYVIGAARGPKKIGLAINPLLRIRAIQTGHGRLLRLLHACIIPKDAAAAIERRAHWLLKDFKAHGEWFDVSAGDAKRAVDQAVAEMGEGEKERPAVGRPPLKLKDPTVKTTLRLPTSLLERVKLVAGDGDASEVIRSGIEAEVRRRERLPRKPSVSKDGES